MKKAQIAAMLVAGGMVGNVSAFSHTANANLWDGIYAGSSLGFAKPKVDNNWVSGARFIDGRALDIPVNHLNKENVSLSFLLD